MLMSKLKLTISRPGIPLRLETRAKVNSDNFYTSRVFESFMEKSYLTINIFI